MCYFFLRSFFCNQGHIYFFSAYALQKFQVNLIEHGYMRLVCKGSLGLVGFFTCQNEYFLSGKRHISAVSDILHVIKTTKDFCVMV